MNSREDGHLTGEPLIAVIGRNVAAGRIDHWREAAVAIPRPYLEALGRAGGRGAVLLPTPLVDAGDCLRRFDGLLLTGGGDIDPLRYGAEPAEEVYGVDAVADEFELGLVSAAIAQSVPLLAICRGLQVLNVARGGTLDQHIVGRPGLEEHGLPGVRAVVHDATVEATSRLAEALGTTTAVASCHHHQAVARLGAGLQVSARTADGVIEGLELDAGAPWVVGVQWHPEDTAATDTVQQRLFETFVARCASRASGEPLVAEARAAGARSATAW